MTEAELTDAKVCFSVFWAGSNQQVAADLVIRFDSNNAWEVSAELQRLVAALAGVEPHQRIKITLGSPAGPQLTPLLRSLKTVLQDTSHTRMLWPKVMMTAWLKLQAGEVNTVFVTQHKHSAFVVDQLVSAYVDRHVSHVYNNLPRAVQCDPDVFITAHILSRGLIGMPDELTSNKRFARDCFMRWNTSLCFLDLSFFDALLRDDEDVVFAAVNRHGSRDFYFASQRLKASKEFVLKVVGLNGLCVRWAATELKQDKEVALAAVGENKAASAYLCAELQDNGDIQQACTTNS